MDGAGDGCRSPGGSPGARYRRLMAPPGPRTPTAGGAHGTDPVDEVLDPASPPPDVFEPVKPRLRGVSHQIAAFVMAGLGGALVVGAPTADARLASVVYTVGVTAMYAVSATYHRGTWSPAVRRRLRRADHSTILLSIAATYTPIVAVGVGGTAGRVVLVAAWTLAAAGAVVRNVWLGAPRWLVAAVYLGVGWVAVGILPLLWSRLGVLTVGLIAAGGLTYTAGAVVYSRRRPDPAPATFGYHEVFHALVVVAGLLLYGAVARVVVAA